MGNLFRLKELVFESDNNACFIERERILNRLEKEMSDYSEPDKYAIILSKLLLEIWHHAQFSGQPFINTTVRMPGPSDVENLCILNIFPLLYIVRCPQNNFLLHFRGKPYEIITVTTDAYYKILILFRILLRFFQRFVMWGNLKYDHYVDRVLTGWNTADRIGGDYRKKVDAILDSQTFPYDEHIGYGDIEFVPRAYKDDPSVPEYAIVTDDLTRDAFYDVNELGSKAGKLTIYLDDDTVSHERLAELILDTRKIFDNAGVKFYCLDFVLEYPKTVDSGKKEGRVEVMGFLYTDIYEEGMVERVKASDEAAKTYYDEQDAEKFKDKIEEKKLHITKASQLRRLCCCLLCA